MLGLSFSFLPSWVWYLLLSAYLVSLQGTTGVNNGIAHSQEFPKNPEFAAIEKEGKTANKSGTPLEDVKKAVKKEIAYAKVMPQILNLRAKPTLSSGVIGKLTEGEEYRIVKRSGNWVQVRFNDAKGWVYRRHVSIDRQMLTDRKKPGISDYRNIQKWMSGNKVKQLIGEPDYVTNYITPVAEEELWEYKMPNSQRLYLTIHNNVLVCIQYSMQP